MQILKYESSNIPTCWNVQVKGHIDGEQAYTQNACLYTCTCVCGDTPTLSTHRWAGMHTETRVFLHVPNSYPLKWKPTVQQMCSHIDLDLTYTQKYICAQTSMHRYTYAHGHTMHTDTRSWLYRYINTDTTRWSQILWNKGDQCVVIMNSVTSQTFTISLHLFLRSSATS